MRFYVHSEMENERTMFDFKLKNESITFEIEMMHVIQISGHWIMMGQNSRRFYIFWKYEMRKEEKEDNNEWGVIQYENEHVIDKWNSGGSSQRFTKIHL